MAQAAQRTASGAGAANGSSNAAAGTAGASTASNKDIPRDARIIGLILASLGVTDAEPGVVAMLLEFAHRYTLEVLQDAQVYAEHAQRPRDPSAASTSPLEVDDLRMAVSSKLEHSYSSPLPKEFLLPLAAQINRVPLPILPESYGIRLPHERDRLTAVNWDLAPVTTKRKYEELDQQQNQSFENGQSSGPTASTSQGGAVNGAAGGGNNGLDMDMTGNDLFGGHGDDDDEDEDDDDDEDMEEVLDTSLQADRAQSKDVEDAEADEDAEEEDAEEDEENAEDDDDDEDGDADADADGQDET